MPSSWIGRRLSVGVAIVFGLGGARDARAEPPTEPAKVVERIVARIKANYAAIETFQGTFESINLDPSVTERTTTTRDLPNGARITMIQEPRTVRTDRITFRGEDVRSDAVDDPQGGVFALYRGVWIQYSPALQIAWQRLPEQMPGMTPIDPREIGSNELRERLTDNLARDEAIATEAVKGAEGQPLVRCHMKVSDGRRKGFRYRCDFDPAKNDLPVAVAYLHDDGSVNTAIDMVYQEAIPGAWLLQKATTKFFGPKKTQDGNSKDWGGMLTLEAKGPAIVNAKLPDEAFIVKLSAGTSFRDSTGGAVRRGGAVQAPDENGLTKAGDVMPALDLKTLGGKPINAAALKGKTVLITFFATWCGPCLQEMPLIESDLWKPFQSKGLVVLAIGREHTADELLTFNQEGKYSFPIAPDPDRKAFDAFAEKGIPRTYLINAEGKIAYQSLGYTPASFEGLLTAVEKELGATRGE